MASRKPQRRPSVRTFTGQNSLYEQYGEQPNASFDVVPEGAGQYSRQNPYYSKAAKKKSSTAKKVVIGALGALVIAALGCGTAFAMYMNSVNQNLEGGKTEEEKKEIADVLVPRENFTDPFYMMLVGSDAREDDVEMGARSDTNILVRVDPVNAIITMVSIPRDTKIEIDGYGTNKFNAAYNYGGVSSTIREASQLCNVDISHYAEVNFEELIELVDVVGGVEVDVPERIDDPDAGQWSIEAGPQTLDGASALIFARSRAYADGDFTRASNQRLLIEALVNKVLSLPATELPWVIQETAKCVTTDFTVTDLVNLALQFKDFEKITMYSAMVPSGLAMINDISYVIADTAALAEMMRLVEAGEDPSSVVATIGYYEEGSSSSGGGGTDYNNNYNYNYNYETPPPVYEDPGTGGDIGGEEEPPPVEEGGGGEDTPLPAAA